MNVLTAIEALHNELCIHSTNVTFLAYRLPSAHQRTSCLESYTLSSENHARVFALNIDLRVDLVFLSGQR